ncbi:MAG: hypothetical protein EAZ85_10915 [Bacteroidetes bacterium]|nr:MAG: hypothetical protein EAZ85_10915 [Bacteroidota bacterium]TAG87350.1 MAG: hypothetical protein EAZ20_10765 [Bacteroidota bacterium]
MINFFRLTTSFKYIILFSLFLIMRIPALLVDFPLLNPSLSWMLVGERLAQGYQLYTETWDTTAPFSALFFGLIHLVFGKWYLVHQIIAIFFVFLQALWFNQILFKANIFHERTMLPALLYLVMMSIFVDSWVVTPILLANNFLLLFLRYLLMQMNEKQRYNATFEIGAYIAIASLFYLPCVTLLLVTYLTFLLYTNSKIRDYILVLVSFFFTMGIVLLTFYMFNAEYAFYFNYLRPLLLLKIQFYIQFYELLLLASVSILLVILNIFLSPRYRRYNNYQNRTQTVITFWWFISLLSVFLDYKLSAYSLCLLAIPTAFLLSHLFLQLTHKIMAELVFSFLLAWHLFFTYVSLYNANLILPFKQLGGVDIPLKIHTEKLLTQLDKQNLAYKNKKILVLGNNLSPYMYARLATPYLNGDLAQTHWQNLNQYNIVLETYSNFEKDMPQVIIDQNNKINQIFAALPLLAEKYEKSKNKNIYLLKSTKK